MKRIHIILALAVASLASIAATPAPSSIRPIVVSVGGGADNVFTIQVVMDSAAPEDTYVNVAPSDQSKFSAFPTAVLVPQGYDSTVFSVRMKTGQTGSFSVGAWTDAGVAVSETVSVADVGR